MKQTSPTFPNRNDAFDLNDEPDKVAAVEEDDEEKSDTRKLSGEVEIGDGIFVPLCSAPTTARRPITNLGLIELS